MESLQEIITLIKDIGFPIVLSLILLKKIDKQEENHTMQITAMCKSLDENTKVITALHTTIKGGE